MGINIKVVAYGIGAIFALFGSLMVYEGNKIIPPNENLVNNGWLLIILAVIIWLIALASRKL